MKGRSLLDVLRNKIEIAMAFRRSEEMSDQEGPDPEIRDLVGELDYKKWYHYTRYQEYDKKVQEAKKRLVESCKNHNWEIDSNNYECRTHWECSKCGAYK